MHNNASFPNPFLLAVGSEMFKYTKQVSEVSLQIVLSKHIFTDNGVIY